MTSHAPALSGRVAVVTGGGRGIGRAIAGALAAAGARIAIAGRDERALAETAAEIRAQGGEALAVRCDVARADDVAHLAAATREALGPASIVVNNAGIARSAKLADTDEALWESVLAVNLTGAYRVTRAFLDGVLAAGRAGRVVFVASTAARIGFPYTSAYCASKHGVLGLARALAVELAPRGPTVNCVCPGWVDTDMARNAIARIVAATKRTPEHAEQELARMSPQRRLMTADEVARAALFLVSDAAAGITGQALNVDGGQVMS